MELEVLFHLLGGLDGIAQIFGSKQEAFVGGVLVGAFLRNKATRLVRAASKKASSGSSSERPSVKQ